MKDEKKKIIVPLIVGIGTLLILVFSAAYAYFQVQTSNNFGTTTIEGTADEIGSVALNGTSASLRLHLSGPDMMQDEEDITYWATSDGTPSTTENSIVVGNLVTESTRVYKCDYTIRVTDETPSGSKNMYTSFQGMSGKSAGQIVLEVGGQTYDFITTDLFPITVSKTINGISANPVKTIKASLKVVNKREVIQDDLAGSTINLNVEATAFNCVVSANEAGTMFVNGTDLNIKMKQLAGDDTSTNGAKTVNTSITAIKKYTGTPSASNMTNNNIVSTDVSVYPIYMWYDNGTIYYYSEDNNVKLNTDAEASFRQMSNLTDISGLEYINTSKTENFRALFANDSSLANLNPIANWNVSSLIDMAGMFQKNIELIDLSPLANWNVSNVTSLNGTFLDCLSLTNVNPLANWNVSNVENMRSLFSVNSSTFTNGDRNSLEDISGLSNWNVTKVTTMYAMFQNNTLLTNLSPLEHWDVSNVTSMKYMFINNLSLTDLTPLKNWNVSNVADMQEMFSVGSGRSRVGDPIIDLTPLSGWNVSNVTNMYCMFQNSNIASFVPLANWNVGKVTNFGNTFNQTSKSTITSLKGLENWNVSSATNMESMFADGVALTDVSAINNWDVSNVTNFNKMFSNSKNGIHPEFAKVSGTWSSDGTFVKSGS